jgi:hypothetical protein
LSEIFEIGNKQQIDHIKRIIWLVDANRTAVRSSRHKIPMVNGNFAAIRQMDHERPKWLSVVEVFELLDCHISSQNPTAAILEL